VDATARTASRAVERRTTSDSHRNDAQPPVEDEATPTPAPIVEPHAVDVSAGQRVNGSLARKRSISCAEQSPISFPATSPLRASDVRARARQLLGRDSESLSDRMFVRILKDAHDEGIIDLRRRGNDFEVARAAEGVPWPNNWRNRSSGLPRSVAAFDAGARCSALRHGSARCQTAWASVGTTSGAVERRRG
jgi:hypothetical protein